VYELIEIKDVKSIQIVPYTLMMSSISAVLGLIYAIIFIIIIGISGIFVSGISAGLILTLAIAMILLFPTGSFLLSITQSFLTALLYNVLVSKIGAIKLGFEDLKEIKKVPIVPFALMTSALGGILIFLIMLIVGPILAFGLQAASIAASSAGTAVPGMASFGALGLLGMLILVVGVPIGMFIAIFIVTAIMTFFYNLLAPKIGGIQFNFGNAVDKIYEIESIPVLPFAVITTVVITLFSLLTQGISLIIAVAMGAGFLSEIISLVISVVFNLIFGLIIYALTAFLYNYLKPRIGGIKLEIE
jgi:hypothetical protein